jgi:hypothetical protein
MKMDDLEQPWIPMEPSEVPKAFAELVREVGPKHPLRGKTAKAIARRQDCDDVLFQLADRGYAVVHLTFQGNEEIDPRWPETELFDSLEEWKERRMMPDHVDWIS